MHKRKIILGLATAVLLAAPAFGQSMEYQGEQAPQAPQGDKRPAGMMMRSPGPTPMARPDLGAWWKDSEIARELGLSETQITQIEQTFFDQRLKLIDLNADVQRNEMRLQPLMEADQLDEAKISAQMDQMLAARSRLEKANMMMMISIRKVLTIDQWKKLEGIRAERERRFMRTPRPDGPEGGWMRRGPDGPGGPEGGMMRKRPGDTPPPPPDPQF